MLKYALLCGSISFRLVAAPETTDPPAHQSAQPTPLLTLRAHTDAVYRVQYSPDGKRLATVSADHTAGVWDAATGKREWTLQGHSGPPVAVSFSPDGKRLATVSYRGTVQVYDIATAQTGLVLVTGHPLAFDVVFNAGGQHLITGGGDGLKVWEAGTGRRWSGFRDRGPGLPVYCVATSADGRRWASGDRPGVVTVWESASGQFALKLSGHYGGVMAVAWSPDGQRLATGDCEGRIRVWDLASGKLAMKLRRHGEPVVIALAFTPDGQHLFSAAGPDLAQLGRGRTPSEVGAWNARTGKGKLVLQFGERETVYGLALSPDGARLATAHGDGTVKVWLTKELLGR